MQRRQITRRDVLKNGSAAVAALMTHASLAEFAFPGEGDDETLVPFQDQPATPRGQLDWRKLDDWLTPEQEAFNVQHYGIPEVNPDDHRLEITGLVEEPKTLTPEEIRERPKQDQLMTLECSGNGASPKFMGAIQNAKWTGTPLVPLLEECGLKSDAKEIVFFGADKGEDQFRNASGRFNLKSPFARSMSVDDVLEKEPLLVYERNGEPLSTRHGAPLRLIVPGWYGVANVKWLTRIEARPQRFMGRFMGRDYVTTRGVKRDGETVWIQTSVSAMNLKSIIARITRQPAQGGRIPVKAYGAAWSDGTPIDRVEVKVDGGSWQQAELDEEPQAKYSWRFFSFDAGALSSGRHTLVSRAIDANGRIQPTAEDPEIALKRTYWEAYQQWPREIELEA